MSVISSIDNVAGASIVPGSSITVLPGTVVVFLHKGKPADVLREGTHTIDARTLPELASRTKIQAFGTRAPVDASAYVVSLEQAAVAWESGVVVSQNRQHGLTFSKIAGKTTFQVIDPVIFVTTMLAEASEFAKLKGDKLAQLFPTFLKGRATKFSAQFATKNLPNLGESIVEAWSEIQVYQQVLAMKIDPGQIQVARDTLCRGVGASVAEWMTKHGAGLTGFSIDTIGSVRRDPCVSCRSEVAPTAYAVFRRNISLIYVRFSTSKEGNFCVPCALKASALANCIMLVAGWWGLIGIILTPIYMVLNIGNFIGVLTAQKSSSAGPADMTGK